MASTRRGGGGHDQVDVGGWGRGQPNVDVQLKLEQLA